MSAPPTSTGTTAPASARRRRPALPMFLGMALLTAVAFAFMTATHIIVHALLAVRMSTPQWMALMFVNVALMGSVAVMMHGKARQGAALLLLTGIIGLGLELENHYFIDTPDNTNLVGVGGVATMFYMSSFLMLTFAIVAMSTGAMLVWRPEYRVGMEPAAAKPAEAPSPGPDASDESTAPPPEP